MDGAHRGFILPDLDVAKKAERLWVEVKTKRQSTTTQATGKAEHGIGRHHYYDYLAVQRETGNYVYLAVYEEDTREIIIGRLDQLAMRICRCRNCRAAPASQQYVRNCRMSRGGMVFFLRDGFKMIARLNDDFSIEVAQ